MLEDDLQTQFNGFYHTPHLFKNPIFGLTPLLTTINKTPKFKVEPIKNLRLGQRVERFVSQELNLCKNITILAENCQVQNKKITIGELDGLYLINGKPTHVEIQFKYYLYDKSLGETEIEHCIGPMRRDSLIEKLIKLKNKQLPLLHAKETESILNEVNFKAEDFEQYIYFKAQIFVPLGEKTIFKTLNNDCIYGYYFHYDQLNEFNDCKFYKPKKTDWLVNTTANTSWKSYNEILPELMIYKDEKFSPLLWIKKPNGELSKYFVVPHKSI